MNGALRNALLPFARIPIDPEGSDMVPVQATIARADIKNARTVLATYNAALPVEEYAKTHDYHLSDRAPAVTFEAIKAELYLLNLASGDETITNQYAERLCRAALSAHPEPRQGHVVRYGTTTSASSKGRFERTVGAVRCPTMASSVWPVSGQRTRITHTPPAPSPSTSTLRLPRFTGPR